MSAVPILAGNFTNTFVIKFRLGQKYNKIQFSIKILLVRSSSGICVWSNNNGNSESGNYSECQDFDKEVNKSCKAMVFSPNGKYFAWTNSTKYY